ncbi:uncharacterized protein LOC131879895 [Tigriopus californicus]|uniref:uncharacterized protein LOC131879895 n=1 Tax=Tigriopus californicus TaxID=6832 RepID=UPI0027DA4333|nr:uncharacterized protein LOC131879895 [Tigriopus californicus]
MNGPNHIQSHDSGTLLSDNARSDSIHEGGSTSVFRQATWLLIPTPHPHVTSLLTNNNILKNLVMFLAIIFVVVVQSVGPSYSETISEIYGGEVLPSDHYFESGPFGGTQGGEWFTDFWQSLNGRVIKPTHWPDAINVRSGERVDSIQMFYGPYHGALHGGEGGSLGKIKLYAGDRIVRVTGRQGFGPGAGVDQLNFYTSSGKRLGPYGGTGGYFFEARPPQDDCFLAWISGRSHLRLDSISFHWRCATSYRLQAQKDPPTYDNLGLHNYFPQSNSQFSKSSQISFCLIPLTVLSIILHQDRMFLLHS